MTRETPPLQEKDQFEQDFIKSMPICLQKPLWIQPSAWVTHIPFAFWLVSVLKPALFVELGTFYGASFAAFCQEISRERLECFCYAIDTWEGDAQSGYYGDGIYHKLFHANASRYGDFAFLIRTTFDEAVGLFDDHSIDLLHIDGFHSQEAILHDFETWFPKLSGRAVVLFHDINARMPGYGGFLAWNELKDRYPSCAFSHGFGLGVLLVGEDQPATLLEFCARIHEVSPFFKAAGELDLALFNTEFRCRQTLPFETKPALKRLKSCLSRLKRKVLE